MISLSDLDDTEVRDSQKRRFLCHSRTPHAGQTTPPVYINKPSNEDFLKEWMALIESHSASAAFSIADSLAKTLPERRLKILRQYKGYFDASGQNIIGPIGTNPCGEIICNQSSSAKPFRNRRSR